jgi:hypothetical protein
MKRLIGSAAIAAAFALPLTAQANTVNPQVVQSPGIQGTISSIDGKYGLTIREVNGPLERVMLHRGTIIAPAGLRLAPGMLVTVLGHPDGVGFTANAIDAPIEDAMRPARSAATGIDAVPPSFAPNGTFETSGPTAEGGG